MLLASVLAAPARGIFYRPSISYFMTRLWFSDRVLFWKAAEQFFEKKPANTSSVVAITAARAIFEVAQTNDDLSPLFRNVARNQVKDNSLSVANRTGAWRNRL